MTGRERVTCAVEHRTPDRIPIAEHFWEDTLSRWRSEGFPEGVSPDDYFDFDIIHLGVDPSPRFRAYLIDEDGEWRTLQDRFGYVVRMVKGKSRTMDYISHPVGNRDDWTRVKEMFVLKQGETARIDDVAFPFRLEPEPTWEEMREKYRRLHGTGKYLLGTAYGPHEAVWRMRGFTETLYDLVLDPEFVGEIAWVYIGFLMQVLKKGIDEGVVLDGFMMVDDIAATRGMLFSPDQWRAIYKPHIARLGSFLHDNGIHFWMHSCGNGEAVFDDLIECGLDVINPLEAKSGLDVRTLKNRYGSCLAFYGNIDVIAMTESEEAVGREITAKLESFRTGGGYIAHSDHSIPPEISFERYRYVVDLVRREGVCAV